MSNAAIHTPARRSAFFDHLRAPIFAEILRNRPIALLLALIAGGQLATAFVHVTIIHCPFASVTGLPCPGCGLTRATAYCATGHFYQALSQHAFAPFVLLGMILLGIASVAPGAMRDRLARAVAAVEHRTAILPLLFALLLLYWIVRLIVAPHAALVEFRL